MAPITATNLGLPKQKIDDATLVDFIQKLSRFNTSTPEVLLPGQAEALKDSAPSNLINDIDGLVLELSHHQHWRYQEKADLYEWTQALDAVDAALTTIIAKNPGLILIGNEGGEKYAKSHHIVESVPDSVISSVVIILRFISCLLRNSTSSKSIFNSIDQVIELLGAADDNIVDLAIEVLANLVSPPLAHHQLTPEVNQYTNPLASCKASVHEKIMCYARGWGSRGSGLGLYACITADDSTFGQGSLPLYAGELAFEYYDATNSIKTIQLRREQILSSNASKSNHSTSYLFFNCLEQAGGRNNIPSEKLFALLAQIRLAKDFQTNSTRTNAVERRLKAFICALHAHPSQEVLTGYFQAQPELCVEMIDLLKPTISSSSVSSTPLSSSSNFMGNIGHSHIAITGIAESSEVPYSVKKVAVEALAAVVSRRDGSSGGTPPRHFNVLQELGVGKGQYLGFLPTLIRYSLASLNTYLTMETVEEDKSHFRNSKDASNFSIDLGFAFVDAVKEKAKPPDHQIERGLEFIDAVLTLTSAVVSVPNGTASLTDCGLIPALVSTIALHSRIVAKNNVSDSSWKESYSDCLMNYISAQAIQIIDGAIATHSTALNVFFDLKGIDLLVSRLHSEIQKTKQRGAQMFVVEKQKQETDAMDVDMEDKNEKEIRPFQNNSIITYVEDRIRPLTASRRVLLYCIISCLNVILHQQESTTTTPSGGAQLRTKELTESLKDILENIKSYGGALAALTATLLSDVMNSDPQVVHHVHSSGLSTSFLSMLKATDNKKEKTFEKGEEFWDYPNLPLTAELVMALPNVLSALSLTEDGAKIVKASNPFPSLLSIFYCPHYVMPVSNCLLNEMSAIVGSGLDELMRHVPSLKHLGIKALVEAIDRIALIGKRLLKAEKDAEEEASLNERQRNKLEDDRTCLMQYAYNISQLLEQILHNEILAEPFIDAGGLESVLKLYPVLMPSGYQFLAHVSCLSNPATANITHSTTTNAITVTIKCIASNYDSQKTIQKVSNALDTQLDNLLDKQKRLSSMTTELVRSETGTKTGFLECVPNTPLHMIPNTTENKILSNALASFLREVVVTEWLITILASVVRAACQRSNEMGNNWIGNNRDQWKKEISSLSFLKLMRKVSDFHSSAMFEVCRIRTREEFEELESKRCRSRDHRDPRFGSPKYRLRVVCQEGAVVRDGIDIDSCSSVGSLQMGEIVEAFDRCINSSGVLRYHTSRGWVSEQTRGHGREPIAEVISIKRNSDSGLVQSPYVKGTELKRIEWEVASLRASSASVLGRLQNCQKTLLSCLSRVVVQGIRSIPTRSLSVPQSMASTYAGAIIKLLNTHLESSFEGDFIKESLVLSNERSASSLSPTSQHEKPGNAAISLYLSTALELLHTCLYEEKRERRILNIPLLLSMLGDYWKRYDESSNSSTLPTSGIFGAIRFILKHCLNDMAILAQKEQCLKKKGENKSPNVLKSKSEVSKEFIRLSKSVAASLPPTIHLLRRLASRSLIVDSQISSALSRMKPTDFVALVGDNMNHDRVTNESSKFVAGKLAREVHCALADITIELWTDPRISCVPAHIIHPIVSLIQEMLTCLEEAKKPLTRESISSRSGTSFTSSSSNDGSSRDVSDLQDRVRALRSLSESMSVLFGVSGSSRFSSTSGSEDGQNRPSPPVPPTDAFEPSDDTLNRLTEMGFSREHALEALESTESNALEVAMEYALAHPPSSPSTIERRQAAREERRLRRERAAAENRRLIASNEPAEGSVTTERNDSSSMPTENASSRPSETSNGTMDVDEDAGGYNSDRMDSQNKRNKLNDSQGKDALEVEMNTQKPKDIEKISITRATKCLTSLREKLHTIALNLIEGGSSGLMFKEQLLAVEDFSMPKAYMRLGRFDEGHGFGDGEAEALTTVTCHFLLEICSRYPSDRSKLINSILERIKSHTTTKGSCVCVSDGYESDFACLCHAAVILFRALPRTRGLFLGRGMHSVLLGCVRSFTSPSVDHSTWPKWLPPVLLLLDVFAQPTAAPIEIEESKTEESVDGNVSRKSEFYRACAERKKYSSLVSKVARDIFSSMNGNSTSSGTKKKRQKEKAGKKNENAEIERKHVKMSEKKKEPSFKDQEKLNVKTSESSKRVHESFPPIPVYTPLMPPEEAEMCVSQCLRILRLYSKSASLSEENLEIPPPPPGTVHACLLLLARILRSHKVASNCLRMGGAELLFSLPPNSRFVGNASLVGVILRHMLEDDATLRTSMETEIRTTVTRLHKQQNRDASSRNSSPKVKASSFIQAVIPLICRDSMVFLKAAATTVGVERKSESESRQISGSQARIVLLSGEERAKNIKLLADKFGNNNSGNLNSLGYHVGPHGHQKSGKHTGVHSLSRSLSYGGTPNLKRSRTRSSSDSKISKPKSVHHSSAKRGTTPKRSKKEKSEKNSMPSQVTGNFILLNGSATNHIVSLLLADLTKVAKKEMEQWNNSSSDAISFLRSCDYLEILADLVLAVPACAAAIHRYRSPHPNGFPSLKHPDNSLSVYPDVQGHLKQSSAAVTLLIHGLLPQERRNNLKDIDNHNVKINDKVWKSENEKKKILFLKTKLAQSTSRLLVALCARAGEGRMRVVSGLASALRGKDKLLRSDSNANNKENEMWALQSWAELCIGLAAPRSSCINQDNDSALSFQVVKLMLENGMGHAIMDGIGRINLHHPMASNVASALMRPLEVLTRASVTTEVEKMAKAEEVDKVEVDKKNLKGSEADAAGKIVKNGGRGQQPVASIRRSANNTNQRTESSYADENMLEDGFDPDTAERAQRDARRNARRRDARRINYEINRHMVEGFENDEVEGDDDEDEEDVDGEDEDDDVEMEVLEEVSVTTEEDEDMIGMEEDEESAAENGVEDIEVHLDEENENEEGDEESSSNSEESSGGEDSSESNTSTSDIDSAPPVHGQSDESVDDSEEEEMEEDVNLVDLLGDEEDNDFFENGGGEEDGDDAGTSSDFEFDEGWTRVDSGFRGVLIGSRQNSDTVNEGDGQSRRNIRRRFFLDRIERSDEMLGSIRDILHSSDMQIEALAEIEDHLGIRIMGNHNRSTDNNSNHRQRAANLGAVSGTTRFNNGEDLHSRDRGNVGTLPSVHQANILSESSQLAGYGPAGRWNESSSMEYTYGSGMIRNEHAALFSSSDEQYDVDSIIMPSVLDTQLFPGGTAASMHSRAEQQLHPLLCDIELPPIHSVSSIVEPHSTRNTRISHSGDGRLLGELSFGSIVGSGGFLSSSNGNIIRLNRGPSGTSISDHHWSRNSSNGGNASSAEARWTADGQPLDNTTRDFAHAFEAVLQETIARESSERDESSGSRFLNSRANLNQTNRSSGNDPGDPAPRERSERIPVPGQEILHNAPTIHNFRMNDESNINSDSSNETLAFSTNEEENIENARESATSQTQSTTSMGQEVNANNSDQAALGNERATNQLSSSSNSSNIEENNSEGEGVASSLAAGLRLSPRSDSSAVSVRGNQVSNVSVAVLHENIGSGDSDNPREENPREETAVAGEQNQNRDESVPNPCADDHDTTNNNDEEMINNDSSPEGQSTAPNNQSTGGLTCPPGMDLEVFNSLPIEVQQEVVEQHQATLINVMEQLDSSSGLDPEALAALPEDMQREAIAQEQQERSREQTTPANPSNAQEMDNASFIASLSSPDLRREILLNADAAFLNSLPPDIIAEAQILRERATQLRGDRGSGRAISSATEGTNNNRLPFSRMQSNDNNSNLSISNKKKQRSGKMKVEPDRANVIYMPPSVREEVGPLLTEESIKILLQFTYLLSPIRPKRLLQKLIQNMCTNSIHRDAFLVTFVSLLNDDTKNALRGVKMVQKKQSPSPYSEDEDLSGAKLRKYSSSNVLNDFPPSKLIGTAPEVVLNDFPNVGMFRRRHGITTVASVAANLPTSSRHSRLGEMLPPEVAKRLIEILGFLSKSPRICLNMLVGIDAGYAVEDPLCGLSCLERLLNLLELPLYSKSSTNLEQLLSLLESIVSPLSNVPKVGDSRMEISKKDIDIAATAGKEWATVPQPQIAHHRLKLLCSVLRLETCKDSSFQKVNMITKRLCRVHENRSCILRELAYVAQNLGLDAIRDLKMLGIRLNDAAKKHKHDDSSSVHSLKSTDKVHMNGIGSSQDLHRGTPGSAVALSTSTSEVKLLRVLQTLQSLCAESSDEYNGKKNESQFYVTQEMLSLIKSINLGALWDELSSCLRLVSVLEGVADNEKDMEKSEVSNEKEDSQELEPGAIGSDSKRVKILQNSGAGLLTRFQPTIEAFFVVNASSLADGVERDCEASNKSDKTMTQEKNLLQEENATENKDSLLATLVDGERLVNFASTNKVLLNALLRANSSLLEKGMQAMVHVRQCRPFLDFDVKRQWFKTQLRRQRQQSNRRHGTLRLNIRRKHVFEDTYHQLRHRNADELKGRLHITFRNEEGVDAGGLSREFFGILAKEMFNPNYALFTSTEDGCTFQPNPNSSINPEHLRYFRCVGRIVGKALIDGFLMDAHFTRSLYKHMLGVKPTHHDMQAIDPDFFRNLKMILEYNLDDIGLDHLTFSTEDHSFGRSQTIDLIPNGRNISVTEDSKEKYVRLVCQHRMTNAIQHQIHAYLEGFYELVKPDLISIFTAKELELLISGMPDIDMHDLRKNTDYQGYKATDREIGWFWNIMFSLKRSEKAAFLQFVTGSAKVPLEGFSQLQGMRGTQKFAIHKAGGSNGALMSAHTCFNALDLPVYKSEQEMRDKLIYAITEGAGGFMFA